MIFKTVYFFMIFGIIIYQKVSWNFIFKSTPIHSRLDLKKLCINFIQCKVYFLGKVIYFQYHLIFLFYIYISLNFKLVLGFLTIANYIDLGNGTFNVFQLFAFNQNFRMDVGFYIDFSSLSVPFLYLHDHKNSCMIQMR